MRDVSGSSLPNVSDGHREIIHISYSSQTEIQQEKPAFFRFCATKIYPCRVWGSGPPWPPHTWFASLNSPSSPSSWNSSGISWSVWAGLSCPLGLGLFNPDWKLRACLNQSWKTRIFLLEQKFCFSKSFPHWKPHLPPLRGESGAHGLNSSTALQENGLKFISKLW